MKPGLPRRRLLSPLLALFLATLLCLVPGQNIGLAQMPVSAPGFNLQWNRPVGSVQSLALSPQGQWIAMLLGSGKLSVLTAQNGAPAWSHKVQAATDVAVSDGVGYVLAYSGLDPLDTSLTLMRAGTGQVAWRQSLDGAVWAVAVSHDGMHAAVSTGKRSVYSLTLGASPQADRWQADGVCSSLAYAPNNEYLAAGLWNPGAVECFGAVGNKLWLFPGRSDRCYGVSITPESRYVVSLDYANHKQSHGEVALLGASDGRPQWSYSLDSNSYYCSALGSMDAQTVMASYARIELHGKTVVEPRQLVCLDRDGNLLWDKGGLFLSPTLLCLAPHSEGAVIYDGNRTLYLWDNDGHIINHARLSGQLRKWATTLDNGQLLVYTSDGQLTLYKLD